MVWPSSSSASRRRRTSFVHRRSRTTSGPIGGCTLKTVALRKLEGYDVQEIAAELGASTRTVERKLRLIRAIWEEEVPE